MTMDGDRTCRQGHCMRREVLFFAPALCGSACGSATLKHDGGTGGGALPSDASPPQGGTSGRGDGGAVGTGAAAGAGGISSAAGTRGAAGANGGSGVAGGSLA